MGLFINAKGEIAINPQFDDVGLFADGLGPVKVKDRWGYVDKNGGYATTPQFDSAEEFHEGLAAVTVGKRVGYIDRKGQLVINPQFDAGQEFSEGLAAIELGERWGFVDKAASSWSILNSISSCRSLTALRPWQWGIAGVTSERMGNTSSLRRADDGQHPIDRHRLGGACNGHQLLSGERSSRRNQRGNRYRIGSAGPNRTSPGLSNPDSDDIVFVDGSFTQSPKEIE